MPGFLVYIQFFHLAILYNKPYGRLKDMKPRFPCSTGINMQEVQLPVGHYFQYM